VDDKKLEQKLEQEGSGSVVTIPFRADTDAVIGVLNGQMVKNMENKQAVLEVETGAATYTIPAQMFNIDAISEQLGRDIELKDIRVQIEISKADQETVKIAEDSAGRGGYAIIVPPLEFTVRCIYGDITVEIEGFKAFVEMAVAIPDGVDPDRITTGIVMEPDGTARHVPTKIIVIDGRYYAKINSLTNSTYTVIWNPVEFGDVVNHWAKADANDMGSRMVVSGT
jgi:hypothetical protein